jgi:hypothetical protein
LRTLRKKRTKRTQSDFTTAQESAQHFPRIKPSHRLAGDNDKRVDAKRAGHTLPFRNWPGTSSPKTMVRRARRHVCQAIVLLINLHDPAERSARVIEALFDNVDSDPKLGATAGKASAKVMDNPRCRAFWH